MRANGFRAGSAPPPERLADILRAKGGAASLIALAPCDTLGTAITTMQTHGISQLPVLDNGRVVGSLSESSVMKLLHDGIAPIGRDIASVMAKPLPTLEEKADVTEAYRLLVAGAPAIVALRHGRAVGIVSRTDLISAWACRLRPESERAGPGAFSEPESSPAPPESLLTPIPGGP